MNKRERDDGECRQKEMKERKYESGKMMVSYLLARGKLVLVICLHKVYRAKKKGTRTPKGFL